VARRRFSRKMSTLMGANVCETSLMPPIRGMCELLGLLFAQQVVWKKQHASQMETYDDWIPPSSSSSDPPPQYPQYPQRHQQVPNLVGFAVLGGDKISFALTCKLLPTDIEALNKIRQCISQVQSSGTHDKHDPEHLRKLVLQWFSTPREQLHPSTQQGEEIWEPNKRQRHDTSPRNGSEEDLQLPDLKVPDGTIITEGDYMHEQHRWRKKMKRQFLDVTTLAPACAVCEAKFYVSREKAEEYERRSLLLGKILMRYRMLTLFEDKCWAVCWVHNCNCRVSSLDSMVPLGDKLREQRPPRALQLLAPHIRGAAFVLGASYFVVPEDCATAEARQLSPDEQKLCTAVRDIRGRLQRGHQQQSVPPLSYIKCDKGHIVGIELALRGEEPCRLVLEASPLALCLCGRAQLRKYEEGSSGGAVTQKTHCAWTHINWDKDRDGVSFARMRQLLANFEKEYAQRPNIIPCEICETEFKDGEFNDKCRKPRGRSRANDPPTDNEKKAWCQFMMHCTTPAHREAVATYTVEADR